MPYPYVLQCRESVPGKVKIKHDVGITTDGDVSRTLSKSAKCGACDIFMAACDGDWPAIQMFLKMGANIDDMGQPNPPYGPPFDRRTLFSAPPLCYAAGYGREKAVAALLKEGADVLKTSSTGFKAWDYARHRGYTNIMAILEAAERERENGRSSGEGVGNGIIS